MEGVVACCGQTAIAAGPCLGKEVCAVLCSIVDHVKMRIMCDFGLVGSLPAFFAGAVLTRIVPESGDASGEPPEQLASTVMQSGPYQPHVDRARVISDDYAAVLYLCSQGEAFGGGGLAFMDDAADCWVAPRRGRLVTFSAGPENLHRVDRVTWGARFALAMWFTLSERHAVELPRPPVCGAVSQGVDDYELVD
eukprot:gnl/TRDRNA2_/TRDRNA2_93713_c0_seq1.p1 gnl/TRDRNA2_/TRDRNA2_93713_c0~~gnl/TRDRNA2_/TRDRNA2_93713_c0_seq1.p1  ORF type:complete len:194 (-),score=28.28 gnl/TRDRNA2_/TRDRNA2_93713_c0_seq1:32-613(-)